MAKNIPAAAGENGGRKSGEKRKAGVNRRRRKSAMKISMAAIKAYPYRKWRRRRESGMAKAAAGWRKHGVKSAA